MRVYEVCNLAFILRLWLENSSDDDQVVRGSLTHIPSGDKRYFQDLEVLLEVLRRYLQAWAQDPVSQETVSCATGSQPGQPAGTEPAKPGPKYP
jgi:hypothetical protein